MSFENSELETNDLQEENNVSSETVSADTAMNKNGIYKMQWKAANAIGWRYALFAIAVIAAQLIIGNAVALFAPGFYKDNIVFVSLMLTLVSVDIIGVIVAFLLNLSLEKEKIEKPKMGFFLTLLIVILSIFLSAGLVGLGTLIGLPIHLLLTLPFGGDGSSDVAMLMLESNMFLRILVVGIGAPVFEELIFRKFLVDRTIKHGIFPAVFLSGIMFGLFHGNFQQFFFAMFIGWFFAYIYAKTGRVWITILLHMVINMTSSVGTVFFTKQFLDAVGNGTEAEIMMAMETNPFAVVGYLGWMCFLLLAVIFGLFLWIIVIFYILYRVIFKKEEITAPKYNVFKTALLCIGNFGFILFFMVTSFLFANSYLFPAITYFITK